MFKRKENLPSTSKEPEISIRDKDQTQKEPWTRKFCRYLYDRDKQLFCGRTCKSWFMIVAYSIMYLIFLSAYTMIFLYCSLAIIKHGSDFEMSEKLKLYTYSENGIGLSSTPTSVNKQPLIWYANKPEKYQKYVKSIDNLLGKRRKRDTNLVLGPCGTHPYGYGDRPCVIIRINKQLKWSAKPLNSNSSNITNVPSVVKNWIDVYDPKLWLFCSGYNNYDKEHVNSIKYYPYPPGFDPELFPLNITNDSPLIAVQISDFTFGISLAIECSLWYEGGVSKTEFLLYVTDKGRSI